MNKGISSIAFALVPQIDRVSEYVFSAKADGSEFSGAEFDARVLTSWMVTRDHGARVEGLLSERGTLLRFLLHFVIG
jgi:hypothetical protein